MGFGGGIDNSGTVTLTDCTLSGNSAAIAGGINAFSGRVTLTNCTVSNNSAQTGGGIDRDLLWRPWRGDAG